MKNRDCNDMKDERICGERKSVISVGFVCDFY